MTGTLDKLLNKILGMRKSTLFLILIFVVGFVLRFIAAVNLGVGADDMHHTLHAVNFLESGKLVTYDQSSGLWHSFTSVIYNFLGTTQISSRIASLLFGSLSILVIYLLSREFFNEKISLVSAFLLAISGFHIKSTMAEMDVMTMFFVLVGMLLFIKALKYGKTGYYVLSGLFIGLSIYTKIYPILFIPSLLLFFIYYNKRQKKKILDKKNIKKIVIFMAIIFIFTIPTLTHNYLLYKDKGFLDLIFTRFTGIGMDVSAQYYSWDSSFGHSNSWKGLFVGDVKHIPNGTPLLLGAINFLRLYDPMIFYLGALGILSILFYRKEKRDYLMFFFLGIVIILPFLASSVLLPKHYIFLELLVIPIAALFVADAGKLTKKIHKKSLSIILLMLFIFSMVFLSFPTNGAHFYSKSNVGQMIDFKKTEVAENSLIVMDSRMYRGRIHWASQERFYLEGSEFINVLNNQDQYPGELIQVDVYYFECVVDDCGWGTVKNQPEFNASMESLTDLFKQNSAVVSTMKEADIDKIYFPVYSADEKVDYINVYNVKMQLKESVLAAANQPKTWFLYPIGYLPVEDNFDYYVTPGFFDAMINRLAHWIVLFAVILAFLSPLYVLYLIIKK